MHLFEIIKLLIFVVLIIALIFHKKIYSFIMSEIKSEDRSSGDFDPEEVDQISWERKLELLLEGMQVRDVEHVIRHYRYEDYTKLGRNYLAALHKRDAKIDIMSNFSPTVTECRRCGKFKVEGYNLPDSCQCEV